MSNPEEKGSPKAVSNQGEASLVHERDRNEIFSGAAGSFLAKALGGFVQYVYAILLSRALGAESVGAYFLAVTVVTLTSVFARLGLEHGVLRQCAALAVAGRYAAAQRAVYRSLLVATSVSGIAAASLVVFSPWFSNLFPDTEQAAPLLRTFAWAIPGLAALQVLHDALRSLRRVTFAVFIYFVVMPLNWVVFWASLSLVTTDLNAASLAYVAGVYVSATISYVAFRHVLRPLAPASLDEGPVVTVRDLLGDGLPLMLPAILGSLVLWTDTIMLGLLGTETDVAIYVNAAKTSALMLGSLTAIHLVFAPMTAQFAAREERSRLVSLSRESGRLALLAAAPLGLLMVLGARPIMGLFGPTFLEGDLTLRFITLGQLSLVATGAARYLLMWSGFASPVMVLTGCLVGAEIVGNALMIPRLGHLGVGVVNGAGSLFLAAAVMILVQVKYRSWVLPRNALKIAGSAGAMLILYEAVGFVVPPLVALGLSGIVSILVTIGWLLSSEERQVLFRWLSPAYLRTVTMRARTSSAGRSSDVGSPMARR